VAVFLYQITVFLQQNTTASLLELYFHDSMQTVYACSGGGGGSQDSRKDCRWGRTITDQLNSTHYSNCQTAVKSYNICIKEVANKL